MADKKLSISKLDALIKSKQTPTVTTINYEIYPDAEIQVKHYIDFNTMLAFVDGVIANVFFVGDDGETHYLPQIVDYSKAMAYIEYFTNIKTDLGSTRVYSMLYGTEIMRDIYKAISPAQYNNLEDAIDSAIANKLAMIQSGERSKLEDATNKIDKASQALEVLAKQFEGLDQTKMQAAFDNLSSMEPKDFITPVIDARDTTNR